jgi:hypothetical protein
MNGATRLALSSCQPPFDPFDNTGHGVTVSDNNFAYRAKCSLATMMVMVMMVMMVAEMTTTIGPGGVFRAGAGWHGHGRDGHNQGK